MCSSNAFLRFPARIEVPNDLGGSVYVLRSDCYASRGRPRSLEPARVLFELEGGATVVLRGQPGPQELPDAVPVYELPGGALGVPTGLVFARFREGTKAAAQGGALEAAGYEIADLPGWAPHAAWIRALGGDLARSLENVNGLGGVSGLESVEPQMLRRAARRR